MDHRMGDQAVSSQREQAVRAVICNPDTNISIHEYTNRGRASQVNNSDTSRSTISAQCMASNHIV